MANTKKNIFTVSKLNAQVRQLLESNLASIWLTGEISNYASPSSGHWYLTLKDSLSQIRCAMFKGRNKSVNFRPENGQQVLVKGNISVYEPRGDYQLLIESMQLAGDGLLAQEFEALKLKLAAAGLFAVGHKHTIPKNIERVGIITSPTGAAIRDVLHVLARRDPAIEVIIYPSMVQGTQADKTLIDAINIANQRNEVDLLLLTRGGGALEDLWCFNSEALAYSIFNSQLPIISAVGHEIDTTISDYVADLRAPTPSAAAELLSQDKQHRLQKLQASRAQVLGSWQHYLLKKRNQHQAASFRLSKQDPLRKLEYLAQRFDEMQFKLNVAMKEALTRASQGQQQAKNRLIQQSPQQKLVLEQRQLSYLTEKLNSLISRKLKDSANQLKSQTQLLDNVSPLATLTRGYSITTRENGQILKNTDEVSQGEIIHSRLMSGVVVSQVISK